HTKSGVNNHGHGALPSIEATSTASLAKARCIVIVMCNRTVVNIWIRGLGTAERINSCTYTTDRITGDIAIIKVYRCRLVKYTPTIAAIARAAILFNGATFKPYSSARKVKHTCSMKACRVL